MRFPSTATAVLLPIALAACIRADSRSRQDRSADRHEQLVEFFLDWRKFAAPDVVDGVPNYSKSAMAAQHQELPTWQRRLAEFDTTGWSVPDRVDVEIIRAEMNGLDFDHRVLRPWERDPAFYKVVYTSQSDVPAHEGPTIHTAIDTWMYDLPLSDSDAGELVARLNTIAPLYESARENLTGNARDLWLAGIYVLGQQPEALNRFAQRVNRADIRAAADNAIAATESLVAWLEEKAPQKTGPSGVGKENYTWFQQNVNLLPYTWQDEVTIMEAELARAHAFLRLTENKNRDLPQLEPFETAEEYDREMRRAVTEYLKFFEDEEIVSLAPYMDEAQMSHVGRFRPSDGPRSFFSEVNYRDALVMRTHSYHWIELARIAYEPHPNPIRSTARLYNIYAGRAEGFATAFEEMMMVAGMFDDRPRAKELIYIMVAQRAARALGGLYMHGLEKDMLGAAQFAAEWTPRGWMPTDSELMKFEQHLYLRQPGYGSSYLLGKVEVEKLIKDVSHSRGDEFSFKDFMDGFNRVGIIPLSLVRWEMTGLQP